MKLHKGRDNLVRAVDVKVELPDYFRTSEICRSWGKRKGAKLRQEGGL